MKKLMLIFGSLFLVFSFVNAQVWSQIGEDIDGDKAGDLSGKSVSLSNDGNTIAIGAYYNDDNGASSGHVKVFQNVNGDWVQLGLNIPGESPGDKSGWSVSLSSDGSILAIGALENSDVALNSGQVRIYENINGTWIQIGEDINGNIAYDHFGFSVSLSSDGSIVAIGAYETSGVGYAKIFMNVAGTWTQLGGDIIGESIGLYFGWSIDMSSNGTIVAVGDIRNDGNGTDAGHVRVFEYSAGNWVQIGNDIDGVANNDWCGYSISLNETGSIIGIGSKYNDGNGTDAGHVRVFENIEGSWTQIGNEIEGDNAGDYFGCSVQLNSEGTLISIGASGNSENGNDAGHVKVFENNGENWIQIGSNILGESADDLSGWPVSFNSNGDKIAVGAIHNDGNGNDAGHVRVYELLIFPNITSQPADQIDLCPGTLAEFSIVGTNINNYQWQVSVDGGSIWSDLTDNSVYSGSETNTLTVLTAPGLNNNQYSCYLTNEDGATRSESAILLLETIIPVITSIHDDQIIGDGEVCVLPLPDYTNDVSADDNCDTDLDITQSPTAGTTISGVANTITLTVTDDVGNISEVSFNVTVEDIINPVITCVENKTVTADETHFYSVNETEFDPTENTDNCGVSIIENDFNNTSTLDGAQIPEGTTTIVWTITDNAGNENTCSFYITVNTYVSIEMLQQKGISIYPNPTNGIINLEFTNNNIQRLIISDITGKQIIEMPQFQKNETIDLTGFESGVYIIIIQTDKEIFATKIVKE